MKKIQPLKMKIRSVSQGLFHDSRGDVKKLGEAINQIVEKQNEIIEALNELISREDTHGTR